MSSPNQFLEHYHGGTIYKVACGSKTFYSWRTKKGCSVVSRNLEKLKEIISKNKEE